MRCIAYVSKVVKKQNGAVIPTGLSEIFRVARKKNTQISITGILSYRHGHFLQVLEGDEAVLRPLFTKIKADPRHREVEILFDIPISGRSFPDWGLKLLESANKDQHFLTFAKRYSKVITNLNERQKKLISLFYDTETSSSSPIKDYQSKNLKLLAWPDFRMIKPTPVVIELCARLTNKRCSYNELLESREFGTKQQLDKILGAFEALEILGVTSSIDQTVSTKPSGSTPNFYSKMKLFLRR